MNRILSDQRMHVKPTLEVLVYVACEENKRMTMASGHTTRANLMEGIIMETIMILETVFKRGEIDICSTASAIKVDGVISTSLGFMLSRSVIQASYVFRFITTVGSCQAPIPIMGLISDLLKEETPKATKWFINIHQISLS